MLFSTADIVLMCIVTAMSVAVAYLPSPRAKSLVYMLPFPFSAALVSTGAGVDATHLIGFALVWVFVWNVRFLHVVLRLHILLADAVALGLHLAAGLCIAEYVPRRGPAVAPEDLAIEAWLFWGACVVLSAAAVAFTALPHRDEPAHRSPLPVWIKAPLVFLLVAGIVLAKKPLRGFMPSFPMVTVFAVYEARHSLYTLASRMSIFLLAFVPMLILCRLLIPYTDPTVSEALVGLAVGWAAYIPLYLGLEWVHQRRVKRFLAANPPFDDRDADHPDCASPTADPPNETPP